MVVVVVEEEEEGRGVVLLQETGVMIPQTHYVALLPALNEVCEEHGSQKHED